VPDKKPQSIILALDPFNLLDESNMGTGGLIDGKVELLVNRGQAVVFSSSFCHAGGSNNTINKTRYVYCLKHNNVVKKQNISHVMSIKYSFCRSSILTMSQWNNPSWWCSH
jgi:hypothetical protein